MAILSKRPEMTPEELFLAHLELIAALAAHACKRRRLPADAAEEFSSWVKQRILEDDYRIIRKFQGKSSFRTYMTVVVGRLALDYQNHIWGKWVSSVEAERLGEVAMQLEQMLSRDRLTFDEACEILKTNHGVEMSREQLAELAAKLPRRQPPRRMEGEEELRTRAAAQPDPEQRTLGREAQERQRRVLGLLKESLARLPGEDQLIVRMWTEFKIAEIARTLRLDQKRLYPRIEKIFKALRSDLERQGVSREEIREILRFLERDGTDT